MISKRESFRVTTLVIALCLFFGPVCPVRVAAEDDPKPPPQPISGQDKASKSSLTDYADKVWEHKYEAGVVVVLQAGTLYFFTRSRNNSYQRNELRDLSKRMIQIRDKPGGLNDLAREYSNQNRITDNLFRCRVSLLHVYRTLVATQKNGLAVAQRVGHRSKPITNRTLPPPLQANFQDEDELSIPAVFQEQAAADARKGGWSDDPLMIEDRAVQYLKKAVDGAIDTHAKGLVPEDLEPGWFGRRRDDLAGFAWNLTPGRLQRPLIVMSRVGRGAANWSSQTYAWQGTRWLLQTANTVTAVPMKKLLKFALLLSPAIAGTTFIIHDTETEKAKALQKQSAKPAKHYENGANDLFAMVSGKTQVEKITAFWSESDVLKDLGDCPVQLGNDPDGISEWMLMQMNNTVEDVDKEFGPDWPNDPQKKMPALRDYWKRILTAVIEKDERIRNEFEKKYNQAERQEELSKLANQIANYELKPPKKEDKKPDPAKK